MTYYIALPLRVSASPRETFSWFTRRRGGAGFALALLQLAPIAAAAQEPNAVIGDDGVVTQIAVPKDIVVTANGIEQPRAEVGQSISVIDHKTLETQQVSVISDILRTVPGVSIARAGL